METNTQAINPKELKVGDFITVLEWIESKDNSWKGDVLEVKAIDLPYVVAVDKKVERLLGPFNLDVRRVLLKKLSPEYVAARFPAAAEAKTPEAAS